MVSPAILHAASHLLHYELLWESNRFVLVRNPEGGVVATLKPGQRVFVRHGSEVLTLTLRTVPPPPQNTTFQAVRQSANDWKSAWLLLAAINHDRAFYHAPSLLLDPHQSECSFQHSRHMAEQGILSHDQFPADICIPHTIAAENVGVYFGRHDAVFLIHHAMMSEGPCPDPSCPGKEREAHGHYLNLVNPLFRRVGIGIYIHNGITWLTEDFTN
jgi:hypothetical protein